VLPHPPSSPPPQRANELVRQKIHPTSIISGFRLARKEAVKYIKVPTNYLGTGGVRLPAGGCGHTPLPIQAALTASCFQLSAHRLESCSGVQWGGGVGRAWVGEERRVVCQLGLLLLL
jgi:hypothetical protein